MDSLQRDPAKTGVTQRWAACVPAAELGPVAGLRLFAGIEFAIAGDLAWLRGPALTAELERALKQVPGLERFAQLSDERLQPEGSRIADRFLPRLAWKPLAESLPVALPAPALPAELRQRISLTVQRGGKEAPPDALQTTLEQWKRFVLHAPQVRLERLRFAVMENGQVLVAGTPLPPIPGTQFVCCDGILVPCGFGWTPAVAAEVLRQVFRLAGDDLVLLSEDQTAQIIRAEQFVATTRSAVRATVLEGPDGV